MKRNIFHQACGACYIAPRVRVVPFSVENAFLTLSAGAPQSMDFVEPYDDTSFNY